jgi:hypothetical protein
MVSWTCLDTRCQPFGQVPPLPRRDNPGVTQRWFKASKADSLPADRDQSDWHHSQDPYPGRLAVDPPRGPARMRARFGSRLTRRRVMTQAQLADTLAGCVNQQVNQAQPGSITI